MAENDQTREEEQRTEKGGKREARNTQLLFVFLPTEVFSFIKTFHFKGVLLGYGLTQDDLYCYTV